MHRHQFRNFPCLFHSHKMCLLATHFDFFFLQTKTIRLRVVPHFSSGMVERVKRERASNNTSREKGERGWAFSRVGWVSRARSRFARSTIPEDKWGTTCSLETTYEIHTLSHTRSLKGSLFKQEPPSFGDYREYPLGHRLQFNDLSIRP